MVHVLVTGGAGYIGSHAVKALLNNGYNVTVLDNLSKGHLKAVDKRASFIEADLKDTETLDKIFSENAFEAVMHFAGLIEVGASMRNPRQFFDSNCVYGMNLLEAMRKAKVKNIIFSSTAAVYGNPETVPIRENAMLKPTNFYGASKLLFEQLLEHYRNLFGIEYIALRYFNAAGADFSAEIGQDYEPATHLIPRALQSLLGKIQNFQINGDDYPTQDGTCIRDYIHVTDLVDAHVLALQYLMKEQQSDVFNLGNGNGFSVKEVLNVIEKVSGRKISYTVGSRREGDPPVLVADSQKAKNILHWNPRYFQLEDIVSSAWNWHLKHPNGYNL